MNGRIVPLAKTVNKSPFLTHVFGFTIEGLKDFLTNFTTSVENELRDHASRINAVLPMDGTEPMGAPLVLKSYTIATLPSAASWTGGIVYVSDGASNKRLAVSNGSVWKYPDGVNC